MTKADAYRVLGTSRSAGRSKAERLYQQKCRELRLQMVPGMPVAIRQKAQAQLAKVDAAWQVIRAPGPARTATRKPAPQKTAKSSPPRPLPYRESPTLGEAWERVVSAMPFSEPIMAAILVSVLLIMTIALLTSL